MVRPIDSAYFLHCAKLHLPCQWSSTNKEMSSTIKTPSKMPKKSMLAGARKRSRSATYIDSSSFSPENEDSAPECQKKRRVGEVCKAFFSRMSNKRKLFVDDGPTCSDNEEKKSRTYSPPPTPPRPTELESVQQREISDKVRRCMSTSISTNGGFSRPNTTTHRLLPDLEANRRSKPSIDMPHSKHYEDHIDAHDRNNLAQSGRRMSTSTSTNAERFSRPRVSFSRSNVNFIRRSLRGVCPIREPITSRLFSDLEAKGRPKALIAMPDPVHYGDIIDEFDKNTLVQSFPEYPPVFLPNVVESPKKTTIRKRKVFQKILEYAPSTPGSSTENSETFSLPNEEYGTPSSDFIQLARANVDGRRRAFPKMGTLVTGPYVTPSERRSSFMSQTSIRTLSACLDSLTLSSPDKEAAFR